MLPEVKGQQDDQNQEETKRDLEGLEGVGPGNNTISTF